MLTNERERRICAKYSAYDDEGYVHCNECPLRKGNKDIRGTIYDYGMCKATMHYDGHKREWVFDHEELRGWNDGETD